MDETHELPSEDDSRRDAEAPGSGESSWAPGAGEHPTADTAPPAGWTPPPPAGWTPPPPAGWNPPPRPGWTPPPPAGWTPPPPAGWGPAFPPGGWYPPQGGWPGGTGPWEAPPSPFAGDRTLSDSTLADPDAPGAGSAAGYGPGSPPWGGGWASPWSPADRPAPPRRSLPTTITVLLLVAAVLVGLGIGHGVWRTSQGFSSGSSGGSLNPGTTLPSGSGSNGSGNTGSGSSSFDTSAITAKVDPALVDINTTLGYTQGGRAAGTGIVLTSDGEVLTNNHVIAGATSVTATDVGNGHTYRATVIGYDRVHDIAIIQLQHASGLTTASIGDSSSVSVGDKVVGIGNAGGVGGTPSAAAGTVTALNQSITATDESDGSSEQLTGLIQTNANIQQGDSGGALADSQAQVIGVDTAASQGFSLATPSNAGFAIPINQATTIGDAINAGHASSTIHIGPTAFLGVLVDTTGSSSANGVAGAVLSDVVPGEPAARAGLGGGDVITSLGGHPVRSAGALTELLVLYHPDDRVQLGWVDSAGHSHLSTVKLATGPAA